MDLDLDFPAAAASCYIFQEERGRKAKRGRLSWVCASCRVLVLVHHTAYSTQPGVIAGDVVALCIVCVRMRGVVLAFFACWRFSLVFLKFKMV